MRTATRGTSAPQSNPVAPEVQATGATLESLGVQPQAAVADPEKALAETMAALAAVPVSAPVQDAQGTNIFPQAQAAPPVETRAPSRLPELDAAITNSAAAVSPNDQKPTHNPPARPRVSIPRSGPISIPVAVAAELGEFENAYAVNVDTRNDPVKMARFLESVGFNTLVQWIAEHPSEWKTGQIVGFKLEEEGTE